MSDKDKIEDDKLSQAAAQKDEEDKLSVADIEV